MRRAGSARRRRATAISASTVSWPPRVRRAPTPCIPDTGSSPRMPRSRSLSRRRPDVHRTTGGSHRADGEQDRSAACGRCGRCPGRARYGWASRSRCHRCRGRRTRRGDRIPADGEGGRRRWRQGDAGRHEGRRAADAIRAARSESLSAFGDAGIYLERRLDRPRHVEVQLLADQDGTVLPFVERECSIQRRQQKVVEESPSPVVSPALRDAAGGGSRVRGARCRVRERRDDRVPARRARATSTSSK